MKIVIMGCGRVGARLASRLDDEGHEVSVVDIAAASFRRLPEGFLGNLVVGNGVDQDTLREAGIEQADAFVAVTQGDNRNAMAAQVALHLFGVKRAVARIYDPEREKVYMELGLRTVSPTILLSDRLFEAAVSP
jgi:trk system potassium uptake protein TrkA